MATLRTFELSAASSDPALRVFELASVTTGSFTIDAIPDQVVEAFELVTIVAVPTDVVPDSYVWRVISGQPIVLVDVDDTAAFQSTVSTHGDLIIVGVKGIKGVEETPEVTTQVSVYPHLYWTADEASWVPIERPIVLT